MVPSSAALAAARVLALTSGDELMICQQAGYVVDELDLSAWHFEGEAGWDTANNWLQLTPPAGNVENQPQAFIS